LVTECGTAVERSRRNGQGRRRHRPYGGRRSSSPWHFLAWLDDRGTTLGATQQHYLLRDFLIWASARRLAGKITGPALPRSELTGLIAEDSRWQLLGPCFRDPGIPLDVG
jgi:hypothetical protein